MVMIAKGNPSLKAKRHRKQHSGEPCRQQAIVRGPSKHSTAIIFSKIAVRSAIRSTLLTAERLAAASEGRTSYIACKAVHEQEE